MGLCKSCGRKCDSDYCFAHKPRKGMKAKAMGKGIYQQMREGPVLPPVPTYDPVEMIVLFYKMWQSNPHKSEISGTWLGREPLTSFFHHILPKSKYPQAACDKENIIILTIDEHANVESDMYKYAEINRRRELLKIKYNI